MSLTEREQEYLDDIRTRHPGSVMHLDAIAEELATTTKGIRERMDNGDFPIVDKDGGGKLCITTIDLAKFLANKGKKKSPRAADKITKASERPPRRLPNLANAIGRARLQAEFLNDLATAWEVLELKKRQPDTVPARPPRRVDTV
jgi:hypothetical protein